MINTLFLCLLIYMIVIIREYKRLETIKDCFILIISIFMVIVLLTNLFQEGAALAFNGISKSDAYVLPADYYKYTKPFELEMKDSFNNVPNVKELMKNPGKVPYIDKQQKIKYDPAPKAAMPKANFVETNKILGR